MGLLIPLILCKYIFCLIHRVLVPRPSPILILLLMFPTLPRAHTVVVSQSDFSSVFTFS